MIEIKRYNSKDKKLWNSFVRDSNNGTFMFDRGFMEYHKHKFEDYSLLCFKNNSLVGLLPANIVENFIHSHQGLSYGGLIVSKKIKISDYFELFKELLIFVQKQGIERVYLKVIPKIYHKVFSEEVTLAMQLLKATRTRIDSYFVIETREGYKPNRNRKRALKIAKEKNLQFREGGNLDYFWGEILEKNLKTRFGVDPTHSLSEIKFLMKLFPNQIKFYGAYNNEVLKAGVIVFLCDFVTHFQYSSGNDDRSDDAALDFLFDAIIKKYKEKKYVSFGSSSENNGLNINRGLSYWKESLDAKLQIQEYYTIETNNNFLLNEIYK
ncbi:GNAT family N-acetyltransferase [Flavicella sp.]|uniref:GNAT family N-acetyltransferase n=1 Tax=Flavicella sp. TaxID=2957742 RepID=UPI00301788CC